MFLYLILPKIKIAANSGILIGEILYICLFLKKSNKLAMNCSASGAVVYLTYFAVYNYLLCNVANFCIDFSSVTYLLKYFIVIGVYFVTKNTNTSTKEEMVKKYIVLPYVIIVGLSIAIYAIAFFLTRPKIGEILWGYSLGTRLIPIFGIGINLQNGSFQSIGGGSGNLLGSFSILIYVMVLEFRNMRHRKLLIFTVWLVSFLAMSRGILVALSLYTIYKYLIQKKKNVLVVLIAIIGTALLVLFIDKIPILMRLGNTVKDGQLDVSSMGRVENYYNAFSAYFSNWAGMVFGIGNTTDVLNEKINYPIIESFIVETIVSDGLIGAFLAVLFFVSILRKRDKTMLGKVLARYYLIQLLVNWSIVGGDFWGPVNLYITLALLGIEENSSVSSSSSWQILPPSQWRNRTSIV